MKRMEPRPDADTPKPNPREVTEAALFDAAALIDVLLLRTDGQRNALDTARITWSEAASAQQLAHDLLHIAARPFYEAGGEEEPIRQRVLTEARERLKRRETV